MMEITVRYSCKLCNLTEVKVDVPARGQHEDLKRWMDKMGRVIEKDHHARSPMCMSRQMANVMIPAENIGWIGGPPLQ
jgi:hypothetical protein